ncbi:MAG: hypothetical protein ACTSUP_08120 [Candidatus Heimdallarchaeaceae archaeon]
MSKKVITILIFLFLLSMTGCDLFQKVTIHPINREDFFEMKSGTTIIDESGKEITTKEDGCFLSNYYIEEVLKAYVEER